jgi:hypothetical protein
MVAAVHIQAVDGTILIIIIAIGTFFERGFCQCLVFTAHICTEGEDFATVITAVGFTVAIIVLPIETIVRRILGLVLFPAIGAEIERLAVRIVAVNETVFVVVLAVPAFFGRILIFAFLTDGKRLTIGIIAIFQAIAIIILIIHTRGKRILFTFFGLLAECEIAASRIRTIFEPIAIVIEVIGAEITRILNPAVTRLITIIIPSATGAQHPSGAKQCQYQYKTIVKLHVAS